MSQIGILSLRGIEQEGKKYTFTLASGIVAGDEGKPVTLDTSGANKVKLAGDGDRILGQLQSVEVRTVEGITVGTVCLDGNFLFTIDPNATASTPDEIPAIGDYIEGGTSTAGAKGYVHKLQSGGISDFLVVELVDSDTKVVAIKI